VCREFVFPGELTAMTPARDAAIEFIHQRCFNEELEIDIMIALQEALANAVLHGCRNDPSKTIRLAVTLDSSAITIVIQDPGNGFDTAAASDSSEEGTNLTDHGRGIMLMRSLMDEVTYRHHGSQVQLKKLLPANC
jgi:serine/threonine-protein kinase RsbW